MRSFAGLSRVPVRPAVPMSRDSREYADINNALMRFMACNYVPLALVENENFRCFVASVNPS